MDKKNILFNKIINRIHKKRQSIAKRRIAIFVFIFIGSIIAIFPAFRALEKSIVASGFMQFLSLIFSYFKIVMTYWQSFMLSLLESLPIVDLTIFLIVILAFLESVKFLVKDINFLLPQHNH